MKLQHSKDIRRITDENNNELFYFTGIHLDDLNLILGRVNTYGKYSEDFRKRIKEILFNDLLSTADKLIEINNLL